MSNQVNNPWHFSGFSSAAGIIVNTSELQPSQEWGTQNRKFKLRGFSVSGSTAVAISTENIKLNYGDSSDATLTTIFVCKEPGVSMQGVSQMEGLEAGYFSLRTTVAHADAGLVGMLWGA